MVTGGDIRLLPEPYDRYIATQTGTLLALACKWKMPWIDAYVWNLQHH